MSLSLSPNIDDLEFSSSASTHTLRVELTATNNNAHPVVFKISTTAPKVYCVKPNIGKINPGESVYISIQLSPRGPNYPRHVKNRGKFLIESAPLESEQERLRPREVLASAEKDDVYRQKFRVYLPIDVGTIAMDTPSEEKLEPEYGTIYPSHDVHSFPKRHSPPPKYDEKSDAPSRPQHTGDTIPVNGLWRSISRLFRRPTTIHDPRAARSPFPEYYPINSADTTRTVSTLTSDRDLAVQLADARAEVRMLRARLSAVRSLSTG